MIRSLTCAALLPLTTGAAFAQGGQPCTIDHVCDRLSSCAAMPASATHYLDVIPGTGGQGWIWRTEGGSRQGYTIPDPTGDEVLTILFPGEGLDIPMMLVSVSITGSFAMTLHSWMFDTVEVTVTTYHGTCAAAG